MRVFTNLSGSRNKKTMQFHYQNGSKKQNISSALTGCKNSYAYVDEKSIETKGSKEVHKETLNKVLIKVDEENLPILVGKCKLSC